MDTEFDENRKNRIHVINVRFKNNKYFIVLSDETEIDWDYWISLSKKERWNYS